MTKPKCACGKEADPRPGVNVCTDCLEKFIARYLGTLSDRDMGPAYSSQSGATGRLSLSIAEERKVSSNLAKVQKDIEEATEKALRAVREAKKVGVIAENMYPLRVAINEYREKCGYLEGVILERDKLITFLYNKLEKYEQCENKEGESLGD